MGNASAMAAMNTSQRLVAPDVLGRVLWMTLDLHSTELKVDPRATNAPTSGTVAVCGDKWCGWNRYPYCAAMTGALVHLTLSMCWVSCSQTSLWRGLTLELTGGREAAPAPPASGPLERGVRRRVPWLRPWH